MGHIAVSATEASSVPRNLATWSKRTSSHSKYFHCLLDIFESYCSNLTHRTRRPIWGDSAVSTTGSYLLFTRLETLTICSCNYFTFTTFSVNPQSTLVYELLYRQGRKLGVPVLLGSWDSPHLKLILHPLTVISMLDVYS